MSQHHQIYLDDTAIDDMLTIVEHILIFQDLSVTELAHKAKMPVIKVKHILNTISECLNMHQNNNKEVSRVVINRQIN